VIGYDTDTYTYEDGTLIQFVDRESHLKLVWKGISSTNVMTVQAQ
jgi:hypothetical protein